MLGDLFGLLPVLPVALSFPGWSQYVNGLESVLNWLANGLNSGGLAIIVFTILVKTALMPLTVQSLRSSKAMQELQPKIKELQKKHGKDRQRLSQETMKLYSEHRVNPMAGCLPMLIQIPIFFGVYQAIVNLSRSEQGQWANGFLWLNDLGAADPIKVLPIAAGVFQFVQTKMMRPAYQKVTDPQQAMMNTMMNFMPLTVILFGWGFASGAVVYWVAQSVFSVVQQWFITGWGSMKEWAPALPELPEHRRIGYRPPRALDDVVVLSGDEDGVPARPTGAMGWFQRKMEEAQQQAAERSGAQPSRSGAARADGGYQAKVDAATGDGASSRKRATGRSGGGARRAASGRSGDAGRAGKTSNGATESVSAAGAERPVEAVANGRASGNGRGAVAVPRKSRPTRKRDEPTAS